MERKALKDLVLGITWQLVILSILAYSAYLLYTYFFIKNTSAHPEDDSTLLTVIIAVIIIGLIFIAASTTIKSRKIKGSNSETIKMITKMPPAVFKRFVSGLFAKIGYKTQLLPERREGVDVLMTKENTAYFIECIDPKISQTGVDEVSKFYLLIREGLIKGEAKGYLITPNYFTLQAEHFARDKKIELVDRARLIDYIKLSEQNLNPTKKSHQPIAKQAIEGTKKIIKNILKKKRDSKKVNDSHKIKECLQEPAAISIPKEFFDYVELCRKQKIEDARIIEELIRAGWPKEIIFQGIQKK